MIELHLGDCIEVMRGMEANTIDTCITDPLRPAMTPGFVMLRGGYPYLFGDKITNWEAWGA